MEIETAFSTIVLTAHYPDENPKDSAKDVTNVLGYIGIFDGIEKNESSILINNR